MPGSSPSVATHNSFEGGWRERVTALRNVPPILKIVWQSGPAVVTFGIVARIIAPLLPLALAYIHNLIIDILVHLLQTHGPLPSRLWWLLLPGFGLAPRTRMRARMNACSGPLAPT